MSKFTQSKKTKSVLGVVGLAAAASMALTACGSSSSQPSPSPTVAPTSPTAAPTSPTSSPTTTPSPTFNGSVYKINDTARASVEGQKFASNSGVVTVSSDDTKIHVFAEGSMGFTLDMVINAKGQVTSGTFNSNDKTKGNYTIRKGGTVELGGSRDGFYISTVKDIPVTPTGGNGSFTMSLSIPAGPK